MTEGLLRQRDQLKSRLEIALSGVEGVESSDDDLGARKAEVKALANRIEQLTPRASGMVLYSVLIYWPDSFAEVEAQLEAAAAEIGDLQKSIEKLQSQQQESSAGISRQQKSAERYHAKREMLTQRKEECNNNIRDLGVLPEEAFEKYIDVALDKVRSTLSPLGYNSNLSLARKKLAQGQ